MSEQPQNPSFSHNQPVSNVWKRILFVALTVFFISLLYQTFLFASDNKYQIQAFGEVRDGSQDPPLDLQLHISYPAQVRLEEPGKRGRPILVWLQPKRPITSSDIALPITYTVHFEPAGEGLVFTDNDGIPIAPQAEIELGNRLGGPGVVYLHRAPLVEDISDTVIIEAIVDYPSRPGVPMQNSLRLPVKLEGRLVAGLRRFAELLLGPGTFLLALATALVSFGLQRWVQQDKERREREQSIQANMAKLKSLRPLVVEDISRAVCQWWEYRQKAKTDVDWTEPMLDVELDDIWRSIESQPWQLALLQEAVRHLSNDELPEAKKFARVIPHLKPDSRSPQILAARFLVSYLDKDQEELNIALKIGAQSTIEALLWLYQEFGEEVRPIVVPLLAKLAGYPESVKDIHTCLDNLEGARLLREPEFRKPLEELLKDETAPSEAKDIAKKLLEIHEVLHHWPQLWRASRPVETLPVREWLELVGLAHNPFGPERAELDPYLPEYGFYPPALEPGHGLLRGPRPAILFGDSGSGKTASALLLAYDCTYPPAEPREQETFPVYYKPSLDTPTTRLSRRFHLGLISKAVGETLIRFLALNPYAFLEHRASNRSAIAYLMTYSAGSPEILTICLRQAGLSTEGASQRLLAMVTAIGKDIVPDVELNETTQLEMLQRARPFGLICTYILVDVTIDFLDQNKMTDVAQQLQPLLGLVIPLASVGVYPKFLLPEVLRAHLHIPADTAVETIRWTSEELRAMLETRLRAAGIVSLSELFDAHSRIPDPAKRLVEAATGSPRRMIHLGNQLIKEHVIRNPGVPRITRGVLDAVIETTGTG